MSIEKELRLVRHGIEAVLRRLEGRLARPVAISMEDAAVSIGVGKTKLAELIKTGILTTFRVGRRRLVRAEDLEEWARRQAVPVPVKYPKTKRQTEGEKLRAAPRR